MSENRLVSIHLSYSSSYPELEHCCLAKTSDLLELPFVCAKCLVDLAAKSFGIHSLMYVMPPLLIGLNVVCIAKMDCGVL